MDELSTSCRICLKTGCFISIYNRVNGRFISETICYVTGVKIEKFKIVKQPDKICDYCLQQICLAENIKNLTIQSDKYLKSILEVDEKKPEINTLQSQQIPKPTEEKKETKICKTEAQDEPSAHVEVEYGIGNGNNGTNNMTIKKDLDDEIDDDFMDAFDDRFDDSDEVEIIEQPKPPPQKTNPPPQPQPQQLPKPPVRPRINYLDSDVEIDLDGVEIIEQNYRRKPAPKFKVERVFPCAYCGKEFKTEGQVSRHEVLHTGEKPFECDLCGMRFTFKSYIHNHLKVVHLKVKNFRCDICGFLMYSKTHHREHKKTHDPNAKRSEVCGVCGKSFLRKHSLQVHMRIHTGERPYKCHLCTNTYMHGTDLKRHIMTHTGERPYKCQFCDRGFIKRSCLQSHENTHKR